MANNRRILIRELPTGKLAPDNFEMDEQPITCTRRGRSPDPDHPAIPGRRESRLDAGRHLPRRHRSRPGHGQRRHRRGGGVKRLPLQAR